MGDCCSSEGFQFDRNMDEAVSKRRSNRDPNEMFIIRSQSIIELFEKNSLNTRLTEKDADRLTYFFMNEKRMSVKEITLFFLHFYKAIYGIVINDKSIENEILENKILGNKITQLNKHKKLRISTKLNRYYFLHIYELSSIVFMKRFNDYKSKLIEYNEYIAFEEVNYNNFGLTVGKNNIYYNYNNSNNNDYNNDYDDYDYDSYDDELIQRNENENEYNKNNGIKKNSRKNKELKSIRLNDEYNYYFKKCNESWNNVVSICIETNGENSTPVDFDSQYLKVIDQWLYYQNKKDLIFNDASAIHCNWLKDVTNL